MALLELPRTSPPTGEVHGVWLHGGRDSHPVRALLVPSMRTTTAPTVSRNGSTRWWRSLRVIVSARDGHRCQLRIPGVCIGPVVPLYATLDAPAGHLHHTRGRAITGDDPAFLVWSCGPCNMKTGDPTKAPDPPPHPRTRW